VVEEDTSHNLQDTTNRIRHHYTIHRHNTQMVGEDMYHNLQDSPYTFLYYHMCHLHNTNPLHIILCREFLVPLFLLNDDILHTIDGFVRVALVRFDMFLPHNDV
jgi:hypothetical protein